MPVFTAPLHESNDCHNPAGPGGGRFCGDKSTATGTITVTGTYTKRLSLQVAGKEVGFVEYWVPSRTTLAEVQMIGVDKASRGKGYGERLYRELGNHLRKAGLTHIGGEVTSLGVLKLRNKVFGKPDMVADAIQDLTPEEVQKRLPALSPENAEGVIDDAPHVFVRHKLGRKKY